MNIKDFIKECLMFWFYHTNNNKQKSIFFDSFGGQYSDNPKAISEAVHSICPDAKIVWTTNGSSVFPEYVYVVKKGSLEEIKMMARAKVWVTHGTRKSGYYKGKDVLSIGTWHGDKGFKKVGYDALRDLGDNYHLAKSLTDFGNVDYFTTGSCFAEDFIRTGLRYEGEFINKGCPRNDALISCGNSQDRINDLKSQLNLDLKSKILLYAPTFRDHELKQKVNVDLKELLDVLNRGDENWICLVRGHSHVSTIDYSKDDRIIDITGKGDMADYLLCSDCLITDYSSCAGDFILMDRPCILVHFDKEEYESNSRSLYFDPDVSGYVIAKNQNELVEIISNLDTVDWHTVNQKILSFYKSYETGNASNEVARIIEKWLNN